jgi:predicted DNA-binding protein with PD1-like motif
MKYSFDGFNYVVRLDKGDQLSKCLATLVAETKLEGAWVSGIGGTIEVTLGFFDAHKKQYNWRQFSGAREVLSLQGTMGFDSENEFVFHFHGVLGDPDYQTIGGHVKDLVAGATLELFVHRASQPIKRKFDSKTGLRILDI